jgi:hypothetical protein
MGPAGRIIIAQDDIIVIHANINATSVNFNSLGVLDLLVVSSSLSLLPAG